MASSENKNHLEDRGECADRTCTNVEYTERVTTLKREKARAKSNFTRARNKLASLLKEDQPSRREVQDVCSSLDTWMEQAMEVMEKLSDLYIKYEELENGSKVATEMEKIEVEFSTASETAREFLDARRDNSSSVTSETLTIDMLNKMHINDDSETYEKQPLQQVNLQKSNGSMEATESFGQNNMAEQSRVTNSKWTDIETGVHVDSWVQQNEIGLSAIRPENTMNANGGTSGQTSGTAPSLEQDLWRQLKRVEIPVFSGDKRTYQNWKAAFIACIDSAPATAEYKLLQLRQYLSGDALAVIENLGHSSTAYEAAKERLERKYGGRRRQVAIYLDELEQFRQVRSGYANDLDKFADLLDIAIINLKEAGHYHELGDGSLYTKLQRKLPEGMLARYHRWVFENRMQESVTTLRTWVIQEAEFYTIASETVHGFSGYDVTDRSAIRHKNQRTFFGHAKSNQDVKKLRCKVCKMPHGIWTCPTFIQQSVPERWSIAKQNHLCYRCLGEGHLGKFCPRSRQCSQNGCKELHHRLLHRMEPTEQEVHSLDETEANTTECSQNAHPTEEAVSLVTEGKHSREHTTMMTQNRVQHDVIGLRTVPVTLKNGDRSLTVNALLDDASTKTYINDDVAAELGLRGKTEKVTVNVLNGQVETFETRPVNVELQSVDGNVSVSVSAYTANRVTGSMTVVDWNKYKIQWPHLKNVSFQLSTTRPIVDILIGLDCADLHYALKEIRGNPGEPVARLTPLGWTCIGNPEPVSKSVLQTNFAHTYFVKDVSEIEQLNQNLKKFWETESVSTTLETPIVRTDEQMALSKVKQSVTYAQQMYRVCVPWKCDDPLLPNNYKMALNRLENTEKRLKRSPEISQAYSGCINKYIEKGYVRKLAENEHSATRWLLPHFPVLRPDKETTKTRIVFDAAAKFEEMSLNDQIYQGPKLQRELFDVLLRLRRLPIAIVCDIEEMYLRIGLADCDKPYHRFLWREMDQSRSPDVYEFDRVVFGVNSSPFQAQFVLRHHAQEFQRKFPMAAETILKSTYMDDSMDSVLNEEQGVRLYQELSSLLTHAGMHARKWLSNSQEVLHEIPIKDRKSEVDLDTEQLPSAKTLGVWWSADHDTLTFRENAPGNDMRYTKRNFLKKIASLFDPLGLLAPFTVRAKMLLQDMWTAGLDWDEEMSESLTKEAQDWFRELPYLKRLQIPRCLQEKTKTVNAIALHTFVDASENAYGAVVYARYSYEDGSLSSNIVAAKTRVAPTIATSIPRLELMGAVVGVRMAKRISATLDIPMNTSVFWSDSVNVLWWVRGRSRQFKPFVANRVGEIQSISDPAQWRYVPTSINPADFLSRGMKAEDLKKCDVWWKGPEYLLQPETAWPSNRTVNGPIENAELKLGSKLKTPKEIPMTTNHTESQRYEPTFQAFVTTFDSDAQPTIDPRRYSSWLKLRRITAWMMRFVSNCQRKKEERIAGELTEGELKVAEIQLIKEAQREEFTEEYKALTGRRSIPSRSKLLGLTPMLDEDGLIRSNGRLTNAKFLSFDVRYPVILPRKGWVTKLIIKDVHEQGNHASGTNHTLAALSARYWIVSGREAIREWEKECMMCRRRKSKACQPIMAPLPVSRIETSLRAFTKTAVDYGGPFVTVQGRGKRREKRYLCLFTCMTSRAVHLEIAYGLDTDSFLNAFFRMASRRGLPDTMYSDNGTNFKGADKELKSLLTQLDQTKINSSIANKGVKWYFNPPLAPHFGGVHESMMKSAKRAINAILGNADITDEELMTAIIGAEGLINSRPLTYQTADPSDDVPLTPNHFLHGQAGGQFAPTSTDETDFNPRRRWRRVQELVRHFWHRWLREWLPELSGRRKWLQPGRDVKVGDVVLVVSPETARGNWPLGRILETYPGKDGQVRVAKIQVGQGTMTRAVTKLCPLELEN